MQEPIPQWFAEAEFWDLGVLSARGVGGRPTSTPNSLLAAIPQHSISKKWLRAAAGMVVASALVLAPRAASNVLVRPGSVEVDVSGARAEAPVVHELGPEDLHERVPDLKKASRLIRGLRPVESYDDYV